MPTAKLVFIDESGVNTNQTRHYGRSFAGERVIDRVPLNTKANFTVVSAIRSDGNIVPQVIAGAMTGNKFKAYLKDVLLPTLNPGDIIIADNLKSHKVEGVKEILQDKSINIVYLPPYSPDLNPIEEMWSKMKAFLRKLKCRLRDSIPSAILSALNTVSRFDILSWFRHANYGVL